MIILSVLVVSYNTLECIKECVKSFSNIRRNDIELIIFDNNSKDNSIEYLKSITDSNIKIIFNKSNDGFAKGMNQCFKISQGKYVMTFNPDATLYDNTIDTIVNYFEENQTVGLIAVANKSLNNIIELPVVDFKLINKIETFKYMLPSLNKLRGTSPEINWIWGTGITVRRNLFEKELFIEDNFLFWEEYYLAKKIKEQNYKLVLLKSTFIDHLGSVSFKKNTTILKKIRLLSFYNGHKPKIIEFGKLLTFLSYIFIIIDCSIVITILKCKSFFQRDNFEREISIIDLESKITAFYNLIFKKNIVKDFQDSLVKELNS